MPGADLAIQWKSTVADVMIMAWSSFFQMSEAPLAISLTMYCNHSRTTLHARTLCGAATPLLPLAQNTVYILMTRDVIVAADVM
mmetsp:Transcript_7290/g.13050  ORF Transcript_7290/g.13050 Transcript_7290/m.13050 type:complete len:84 (+) Transcript_7290:775-1026(+)